MKAAIYRGPKDLKVEIVDEPEVQAGQLKLKIHACATCGTDAKIFHVGHPRLTPPQIIGHEIAGEVVEIGAGVSGFKVGDRVQVIAAIPCGQCWACLEGRMTVCPNQLSMGYQFPGGFAEYMIVPEEVIRVAGVNLIPEGVSYIEAAVVEPLACVLNAQQLAKVTAGDTVLVMGAGPIGCLHVRLARSLGAKEVYLADINGDRLKISADVVKPDAAIDMSKFDLAEEIKKLTGDKGPTVIITAAPSGQAQEQAIAMAAPGGRISFFGGLPKDKPIIQADSNLIHYKELTILGANGSSPAQNRQALELIASGSVRVDDLVTHQVSLDDVAKAIDYVTSGESIKVVVLPNGAN
ncbi:MAG: alcohol dehydrogenase [Microbacteriaceae bacterium]|nr:alcohol dehydrogenase [Microbacteriaceae bacterium]